MQKAGTLWYHLTYIHRIYLLYFCVLYKEYQFKRGTAMPRLKLEVLRNLVVQIWE